MNNNLIELLAQLKVNREAFERAKSERQAALAKFESSLEYVHLMQLQAENDADIAEGENKIRLLALEEYDNGNELPEQLAVKMFSVVSITDDLKAKEWCIAHFTPALKLDVKVFEKAAKDGNIPVDLATVKKEARVQIAAKL